MKKHLLFGLVLGAALFTSCSGSGGDDGTDVVTYNKVNVSVDPTDLFSCYSFEDTKHGINVYDQFRTFNSEYGKFIQVRVLFYNKSTDLLVDSIVRYISDTNTITEQINLPAGEYFAVTTLSFADSNNGKSWWVNAGRERLSTSTLEPLSRFSSWSIMSHASESLTVQRGDQNRLTAKPMPVGALVYTFFENFQYISEQTYGTVADNGIRQLALYNRTPGASYNLDPRATNKFNYYADAGSNTWYYAQVMRPNMFGDGSWKFFQTNLYGYCYIMEPQVQLTYGLLHEGETNFSSYGEKSYSMTSGKTYLAYWDYFKVGNPYFGVADNNHWNSYTQTQPTNLNLFEEPYIKWGASKSTVKTQVTSMGYTLMDEDDTSLFFKPKNKEKISGYFFTSNKLSSVNMMFDPSEASIANLRAQLESLGYSYVTENEGYYYYLSSDSKTIAMVNEYVSSDNTKSNFVSFQEYTSSSRSVDANLFVKMKKKAKSFVPFGKVLQVKPMEKDILNSISYMK